MKPFSKKNISKQGEIPERPRYTYDPEPYDQAEERGKKEITQFDPEYTFLLKLIKLVTSKGVPAQEIQAISKAYPFVTVSDVGDLATKIWTLATEKYGIPREFLLENLPKNASLKVADQTDQDQWQSQKETEDMLDHAPGYLAYEYGQDKTADGEFKGSEFSGTDGAPNPLTDIGPWSSPEDHGAKPQKSPFPNTNWLPADDQNLDQQAPSNVAASLKKEALAQQDVVDFYLMSLIPASYLAKEVTPDHYDGLAVFKSIIESLRNEYIERGMAELVDEAETTAWTKAIHDDDMPEQIKKYYTFHDGPIPGGRRDSDDEDSEPQYDYSCENCGAGLDEDDVYNFRDSYYCQDCEQTAVEQAIEEDVAFCDTHKVFVTDARDLKTWLPDYKFDSWDNHSGPEHQVVRFNEGSSIWKEMKGNAINQLRLQFEERKKRREEKQPEQLKLPQTHTEPTEETASLKVHASSGWWEAPTNFDDYSAQDFYTIFKYAPWKHLYGGPLWAEVAKTIGEMQVTTDWQKLVVLIDHFHDLGHNTGKLLDKFPEWHQWFKKLLDMKAQKNSLRNLLPKASKPVQELVTEYLRVHGRDWRADERSDAEKNKKETEAKFYEGEEVLFDGKPVTIGKVNLETTQPSYFITLEDGRSRWAWEEDMEGMPGVTSSLNRPFSKKANPDSRYWIAPDGTEFPVSGIHPIWIQNNGKVLKKYGINPKQATYEIHDQMMASGWTRISTEGRGFQIEIQDLSNLPTYLDDFIAKHFQQNDEILIGNGKQPGVYIREPFPSIQKAVNKALQQQRMGSAKKAAMRGETTNTILQLIHDNGGVTYNIAKGNMAGTPNYSVSIYPDREKIEEGVDFDRLEGYLDGNEDLLMDPNNSFGAWSNEGKVYLDVVVTVPDQAKAIELAKQHNQIAIWDLQNNKEIPTGGTGGSNAHAFSKKSLIKTAEESLLTQPDQNQIAAESSPVYVIAVNNYAEALKRGHSKDRSLEYAIESVQNLEKVDPKKLVEFINTYVPN